MKVLIITDGFPPDELGGASVIAYNHAQLLFEKGIAVSVVTTHREKRETTTFDGFLVHTICTDIHPRLKSYKSLYNRNALQQLRLILEKEKADVVHFHNVHSYISYAAIGLARTYTSKVFITLHDSASFHYGKLYPETVSATHGHVESYKVSPLEQLRLFKLAYNPFRNLVIRYYLCKATKIFAVSSALMKALNDNGINNVDVLHNFIDSSKWVVEESDVTQFRSKYSLNGKRVIFFGGRLSRAKGGDVLVDALGSIAKKVHNVCLLVVGDMDSYSLSMQKKAAQVGVADRLIFAGRLDRANMKYAYAASDLVVAPSLCFDWFPTVIMEGMASKRPVIGSCFGGASEMIDSHVGYVINPLDRGGLEDAVADLLLNKEKSLSYGQAGSERVKSVFNSDVYFDRLMKYYN